MPRTWLGQPLPAPVNNLERARSLLLTQDPRLHKSGLQLMCEFLEALSPTRQDLQLIKKALSRHLDSQDTQVLRWIYKVLGNLADPAYGPYLKRQLRDRDQDPENRTWAVAALAVSTDDWQRDLTALGEDPLVRYQLSASLFGRPRRPRRAVRLALSIDDALTQQWLGLLYGHGRLPVPVQEISELTKSPDARVAEYAIWGLRRARGGGIEDATQDPFSISTAPPNVRRWYYRLLLKDVQNLDRYESQVLAFAQGDEDSTAREGLALGFVGLALPPAWQGVVHDWLSFEKDPYVWEALLRVLGLPSESGDPLIELSHDTPLSPRSIDLGGAGAAYFGRKAFLGEPQPPNRGDRIARQRRDLDFAGPPTTAAAVVLVSDLVAFTELIDAAQVSALNGLLTAMKQVPALVEGDTLFTGDGAITVWRDAERFSSVVEAARRLSEIHASTATAKLRLGLHAGTVLVLTRADGQVQFIGDAINKAVRCCAAAEPGQMVVTSAFHDQIIKPHSQRLAFEFAAVEVVEAKHQVQLQVRRLSLA